MIMYGIANCDTVRKARRWCEDNGVACRFHDIRKQGLDEATLRRWADAVGVKALLNRRGMTWRKLDEASRARAEEEEGALALMLEHPTLIRRPVVEIGEQVFVGFVPDAWREAL